MNNLAYDGGRNPVKERKGDTAKTRDRQSGARGLSSEGMLNRRSRSILLSSLHAMGQNNASVSCVIWGVVGVQRMV